MPPVGAEIAVRLRVAFRMRAIDEKGEIDG